MDAQRDRQRLPALDVRMRGDEADDGGALQAVRAHLSYRPGALRDP